MAQEFNIGRMKAEAMAKAFGVDIEKGRVGVYEDNAENRRLNRVGQSYGHKAEEKPSAGRQPSKKEEQGQGKPSAQQAGGQDIGAAAKSASDGALKRAAADSKAAPEVKAAAEKELKERGVSEKEKPSAETAIKNAEFIIKDYDRMISEAEKRVRDEKNPEVAQFLKEHLDSMKKSQEKLKGKIEGWKKELQQNTKTSKSPNEVKSEEGSKRGSNSAAKELSAILDPLDSWGDDDWNDADKNAELFSQIRSVISKYDMSEQEFRDVAKKYQGLDLVYTDYAPHDKVVPIAKEKIRTELKKFDSFSDDDWNEPDKQQEITDKLTFYVRHYNITEDEWNEIVKPYAEGLSGLPYSDFQ